MQTKQFLVYGRVQGVGFRFFTWREAKKLGLTGNVRNLTDGAVQVIAKGEAAVLEAFERYLHQGSPAARVEQVLVQDYLGNQDFTDFQIVH